MNDSKRGYRYQDRLKSGKKHQLLLLCTKEGNEIFAQTNEFMAFTSNYILEYIRLNGYTLTKFERLCLDNNHKFNRRSLYGLINGDRGDFRLSYFAVPLGLLGVTLNDVFRAYVKYLDEIEAEK